MSDPTARAIAETLRRWYARDVVVPIARGLEYRIQREAREAARRLPFPPRPTGPGRAA